MSIFLCAQSAVAAYRSLAVLSRLRRGLHAMTTPSVPSSAQAIELAQRLQIPLPLHVLVDRVGARRNNKAVVCKVSSTMAGVRAFLEIAPGVFACSPEALFLQLAAGSDFENLLMLGMELVGGFAPNKAARKGLLMREPLTTPEALRDHIEASPSGFGCDRARDAARYLLPDARSPKEAEIALMLALPRRRGGRGVEGLVLNRRVDLPPEGRVIAERSHLVCDIFCETARLELGYDSDDNHLEREDHESDKRRENALRTAGIGFVPMTNGQLHDWATFDAVARRFAHEAGACFKYTSRAIDERQHELWRRLLFFRRIGGRLVDPCGA